MWEDDEALAFRDVNPQAPVHVLIVPKRVIPRLADAAEEDGALLGRLLLASRKVAEKLDLLESGYRVVINSGPDAGESVPHLHVHIVPRRKKDGLKGFFWPRTKYKADEEMEEVKKKITAALQKTRAQN